MILRKNFSALCSFILFILLIVLVINFSVEGIIVGIISDVGTDGKK